MIHGQGQDAATARRRPGLRHMHQGHGIAATGQSQGDRPLARTQPRVQPRRHVGADRIGQSVRQSQSARWLTWVARLRCAGVARSA